MKLPRITLTRALALIALIALVLSFVIAPIARKAEWMGLAREMDTSIRYLKPTQPGALPPGVWDRAHQWVITCYCNVCFSEDHVSMPEMYRLREDMNQKLKEPIDLNTLKWIWRRLGETGFHGKKYIERIAPQVRMSLPAGTW